MSPQIAIYGIDKATRLPCSIREFHEILKRLLIRAYHSQSYSYPFEFEIILVRDGEMQKMNLHHMNCIGPTNVLSFPSISVDTVLKNENFDFDENREQLVLDTASIVLNVDAIRREAKLFKQTKGERMIFLLSHAVGHIMGFEHGQKMDEFCSNLLLGFDLSPFLTKSKND